MKIALVGAECEEDLALRCSRAALEARGHCGFQLAFSVEADLGAPPTARNSQAPYYELGARTIRNPVPLFLRALPVSRYADRHHIPCWPQPPPRTTCHEPEAGP